MKDDESIEFKARLTQSDCSADMPIPAPDLDPVSVSKPCDPAEVIDPKFVPPSLPPAKPVQVKRLPDPVIVGNKLVTVLCTLPQVSGSNYTSVTRQPATETATVLIDEIRVGDSRIPDDELYRIARHSAEIQQLVDTVLRNSPEEDDFAGLIAGATGTTSAIAVAITEVLMAAQETVDSLAITSAQFELNCLWRSRRLWAACADNELGYAVSYGGQLADAVEVPAGFAESTVSQDDADAQALRYALRQLSCLVGNDEQVIACSDMNAAYDVEVDVGAGPVHLSTLDSTLFPEFDALARGEDGRTLKYFVTIPAGEHMAATKIVANTLAVNAAYAALDCFMPSGPVTEACDDTENSTYAHERMMAVYINDEDPQASILNEMATGYSDRDRNDVLEPGYFPDNVGLLEDEIDRRKALLVDLPAGFFVSTVSQAAADALAETYAKSLLVCMWRSPMHVCACLGKEQDPAATWRTFPDAWTEPSGATEEPDSALYSFDVRTDPYDAPRAVTYKTGAPSEFAYYPIVKLLPANSVTDNSMLPGAVTSVTAPVNGDGVLWASIPATCQGKLRCVFQSCLLVLCEPFPDNRQYMRNGEHNWISFRHENGAHELDKQVAGGLWVNDFDERLDTFLASFHSCAETSTNELITYFASCGTDAEAKFYNLRGGYGDAEDGHGMQEVMNVMTAGWFEAAGAAATGGDVPPGTPAKFLHGTVLDGTKSAKGKCSDNPVQGDVISKEQLGYFSGAEGSIRQTNPTSIATVLKLAKSQAIGRLNCTHVAWDRELGRCDTPGHVPARVASIAYEDIPQASTTEVANVALELAILAEMDCQEIAPNQIGMSSMCATVTSLFVDNVGDDDCLPPGVNEIVPVDENGNALVPGVGPLAPIGGPDQMTDAARSFFIVSGCGADGSSDGFILKLLARDSDVAGIEEIWEAAGGGNKIRTVPPSVSTFMAAIRAAAGSSAKDMRLWYLGSIVNKKVANADGVGRPIQRLAQYYTGPLIVTKTCCDSSSSSSSSDSEPSSSEPSSSSDSSDSQSSGSSAGPPSDSYGSDKSTAILKIRSSPTGYKCVFTMESNKVLLAFPVTGVVLTGRETRVKINPDWLEACADHTIRVYGSPTGDTPWPLCARVDDGWLVIRSLPWPFRPRKANVMLWGLRRGHDHKDMDLRTLAQWAANERFLNSAYPADPVLYDFHITPP